MTDSEAGFSQLKPFDSTPKHLELGNPVPVIKPLSVQEIFQVSQKGFGLRNTAPEMLKDERTEGVMGDYLVISNIKSFVSLKDGVMSQRGLPSGYQDLMTNMVVMQGNADLLDGIDNLPERYNQALAAFIKDAQIIRTNGIFSGGNEHVTLEDYLGRLLAESAPAYILIQGQEKGAQLSYDEKRYYGFGKHGKQMIKPEAMVDDCVLTESDIRMMKERYANYLQLTVDTTLDMDGKKIHVGDLPESDILQLTQNHLLQMIRGNIAQAETIKPA